MTIVYRISEADYMDAHDLFAANERPWYRKVTRRALPLVGTFVLAMNAFYLIVDRHPDWVLVGLGFIIGLFLVYLGFVMRLYFRKSYRKDQRFKHDFTAEISDGGIDIVLMRRVNLQTVGLFDRTSRAPVQPLRAGAASQLAKQPRLSDFPGALRAFGRSGCHARESI
jgi:hypothetical protein